MNESDIFKVLISDSGPSRVRPVIKRQMRVGDLGFADLFDTIFPNKYTPRYFS